MHVASVATVAVPDALLTELLQCTSAVTNIAHVRMMMLRSVAFVVFVLSTIFMIPDAKNLGYNECSFVRKFRQSRISYSDISLAYTSIGTNSSAESSSQLFLRPSNNPHILDI